MESDWDIVGFAFSFLSIALYDAYSGFVGQWTVITGITYGMLGILATWVLPKFKRAVISYGGFAIVGTIVYDLITGVLMGPILFGMSFQMAFVGQIPFTI